MLGNFEHTISSLEETKCQNQLFCCNFASRDLNSKFKVRLTASKQLQACS